MSHAATSHATFYEILGVPPAALLPEIKQAHRKLAQQNHPDKLNYLASDFPWVVEEANERFRKITEAFNVLSNEAARSRYDAGLKLPPTGFHPRSATSTYAQRRKQPPTYTSASDDLHTRTAEVPHEDFNRHNPPADSPFHSAEPRAPRHRKNIFLSGVAFVGMVALALAASNDGPLAKELHSLQMDVESSTMAATTDAGPLTRTAAKSPTAGQAKNGTEDGYQFADIRYLRTIFNAYLISRGVPNAAVTHQKEFSLLQHWDPSYYQSKFIVISWENPSSNQTQIGILFLDQPDTVFQATVTRQPGTGRQLQSFVPLQHTPEEMADIRAYWSQSLADPGHAL